MGDRANVGIREKGKYVWLYTHWTGTELPGTVARALARGVRWDDAPYLARIVFCEMVKGQEHEETGFGISATVCENEYELIVLDVDKQQVQFYPPAFEAPKKSDEPKHSYSFEEYVQKYSKNGAVR